LPKKEDGPKELKLGFNMIVYYQNLIDNVDDHSLLVNIANFLQKYHGATLVEVDSVTPVLINEIECIIWDCELLIYYPDTNIVKAISFADSPWKLQGLLNQRCNQDDLLMVGQYQNSLKLGNNCSYRILPTIYTRMSPNICLDTFYSRRIQLNSFEDKFVFRGNVDAGGRGSVKLLTNYDQFVGHDHIDMVDYYNEIIKYKVGLSIPGVGEKCHRDVEYMAIGLPLMKFKYLSTWKPQLIPNYHYISIDRIDEYYERERIGGQEYVDLYINRFNEVKDDRYFLEFISKNARQYYESFLHPNTRLLNIVESLEL
jgi:hypothetical protein